MISLLALLLATPLASAQNTDPSGKDEWGLTATFSGGWYFSDPGENIQSTWTLNPRLGYSLTRNLHLEGHTGWMQAGTRGWGYRYNAFTPRLDLLVLIRPDLPIVPFVAAGPGMYWVRVYRSEDSQNQEELEGSNLGNYKNPDSDLLLNIGPGILIPLAGGMALRFDARYVYTIGQEPYAGNTDRFSNLELTAGFMFRAAERNRDSDGDSIYDKVDTCPEQPEDWDDYQDLDGCPDPDNDGDGVLDVDDECPMKVEDFDDFQDEDGCPEWDNDNDGIPDDLDQCATRREDQDGFKDEDGCPDLDNDNDGIPDLNDRCPNHPEDMDGFQDEDGCEDSDNDGDGLPDALDSCPFQPEIYNGFEDEDGCPDETAPEIERFTGVIHGVNFEVNSDQITVESYRILDEAAAVLVKYPELRIEVQGHTDSDGSEQSNFELSDRRAESVVRYMTGRGVSAERLTWMGYGESRPLVANDSAEGKAINRRVEFHLVGEAQQDASREQ